MTDEPDDRMGLGDVARYLRAPRFIAERDPVDLEGLRHLIGLFFLTALGVIVISGFIGPVVLSGMEGELPRNANEDLLAMNPARLLLIGVVLVPLIEEALFRGWLGSRRFALAGFPVLSVLGAFWMLGLSGLGGGLIVAIVGVLGFLLAAVMARVKGMTQAERDVARARLFPAMFWGSAALFALAHLANYEGGLASPWLLLAIIPQGLVGLVLGYVRMRFGLAPAIGFHGAYNALFLSLGLLAAGMAESAPQSTAIALLF